VLSAILVDLPADADGYNCLLLRGGSQERLTTLQANPQAPTKTGAECIPTPADHFMRFDD